jgi:steroid delta-isomerase-like uncharacterized protein
MSQAENKLLARRFLEEVVNTGAVHRLAEFLASDCVVLPAQVRGLDWFREHMLTFHRCYPDLLVTVDGQITEDDTVATWWTMRGTHSGEWRDVKPTGRPILLSGVNIQKIRGGRIVEHTGFSNSLEALMALGIVRWANPGSDKTI